MTNDSLHLADEAEANEEKRVSYREKLAWLSLIAITVGYGPYFVIVASQARETSPALQQLVLFGAASLLRLVILGAGYVAIRRSAPEDAGAPPDERDRLIAQQSTSRAYSILVAGMIVVGCVMPFSASGWSIVNASIFAIVISEIVQQASTVVSYRRQS